MSQRVEPATCAVIACGAIAHELVAVLRANQWQHVRIQCLPAEWHNTPERITPAVDAWLNTTAGLYATRFVAYGDCGTGGQLDALLQRHGVQRLPGAHCYAFFAGVEAFDALAEPEPGTFYLTDYLARNFERLIIQGLGIERHPELQALYFGNYTRLVYLAQSNDNTCLANATAAAERLQLSLQIVRTGLTPFQATLSLLQPLAA